ncbi:hypothetical protein SANT12839_099480 [Streptomyces antimycoticus]|uniref:Uncharacterized protein n=1 Tax=Streptomyces antimycoticus TaxID=68175 RepID=A0A4D4KQ86_9ACTN|nr:hypothetical protein [Streptomyces antimycoticus]GDY49066.1 hypothetical protein SANT12839_099480 [Streptomyces antimycoticus]
MGEVVLHPASDLISDSEIPAIMGQIRPQWQSKGLIERVRRLLPVDPSSACQRLLNAAVQDLREKVQIAGIDIAAEVATAHKLPPINRGDRGAEDIENYSTAKLIDLSYRMGLLSRPEWRKMTRAYDIRRDLEHEDAEYEAGIEDCIYIFKTCVDAVLSRDPITLIHVSEVKQIVQASGPVAWDPDLLTDYEHAPDTRQLEILKFLLSMALNDSEPELVRGNCYTLIAEISPCTRDGVRVDLAKHQMDKIGRVPLTELQVRVAHAAGILPYFRKAQRTAFFRNQLETLEKIGHRWRANSSHGTALRQFPEFGGLAAVPADVRVQIVRWMTLCYLGEPGGYGTMGRNRKVFYSNSAAPLIEQMFKAGREVIRDDLSGLQDDRAVKRACSDGDVARRFQNLLDLVDV